MVSACGGCQDEADASLRCGYKTPISPHPVTKKVNLHDLFPLDFKGAKTRAIFVQTVIQPAPTQSNPRHAGLCWLKAPAPRIWQRYSARLLLYPQLGLTQAPPTLL